MKRIYHPFNKWEEIAHNMWGDVPDKEKALIQAIEFTSNAKVYGEYMQRVVREWPISCENALTDSNLSKKAWIGHAATALALQVPEDIVRKAWGFLTDEQRTLANAEATRAIKSWEKHYLEGEHIRENMGGTLLF